MECQEKLKGVCARTVTFDLDGDRVSNIRFLGGCHGNLKALSLVLDGWTVEEIAGKLEGNDCSGRGTSCADQFAKALRRAFDKANNK